ncbi:ABC transporter ATP-binding protein [Thermodesulfobacteriota bacterium]
MDLLKTEELTMDFLGLRALDNVNFDVQEGEIYAVIGPNGAGKTTVFNLINKFYKPTAGAIYFKGQEITLLAPHNIPKLGIARTFQNLEIFPTMTALENIMTGAHLTIKAGAFAGMFFGRRGAEEKKAKQKALDMLEFLGISSAEEKIASGLPYGFRKLLEIARALLSEPAILLLDEPAAGMNEREKVEIAEIIKDIRDDLGISVLLVEHDMNLVMGIADRITVLDSGYVIATGDPEHVQNHPKVIEAYLGTEEETEEVHG